MEFYDFESYDNDDSESEGYPDEKYNFSTKSKQRCDSAEGVSNDYKKERQGVLGVVRDPSPGSVTRRQFPEVGDSIIKTRVIERYVNIDSRNRDFKRFPNPNNYEVNLDREYTNVKDVRVVSSQIPNINKNIFSDPLVLRNNCMYWQEFSENCCEIDDFEVLDSQKVVLYVNDVSQEILLAFFSNQSRPHDICRQTCHGMEEKKSMTGSNSLRDFVETLRQGRDVVDVSLWQIKEASGLKLFDQYTIKYTVGKVIKVLRNEDICGFYNALDVRIRFVYWGSCFEDCKLTVGLLCAKNTMNAEIYIQQPVAPGKRKPYGFIQVLDVLGFDRNQTFATKSIEIESGLYDDVRLSNELSLKMTDNKRLYRVTVNEFKNETRLRGFTRRFLGGASIFCRTANASPETTIKRRFVVIIRYLSHGLIENEEVVLEKHIQGVTATQNFEAALKNSLYGRKFAVHLLHAAKIGKDAHGVDIYHDNEIGDFVFYDNRSVSFPIYHNYFYLDMEDVYDTTFCANLFSGFHIGYGIGYPCFKRDRDVNGQWGTEEELCEYIIHEPLSGFGDLIIRFDKMKLILSEKYTMDKILGLAPVDSQTTFTKRCYVRKVLQTDVEEYWHYMFCPEHNLLTGDIIDINNNRGLEVKYISESIFAVVSAKLVLMDETDRKGNTSLLFFNQNPIRLLNRVFSLKADEVIYTDERRKFFKFKNSGVASSFLTDFVLKDNIFQCRQYGDTCFCTVFSIDSTRDYVFGFASLDDDRVVSEFLGLPENEVIDFELTQKNIVCLKYYNHMLLTGNNEVLLSGYLPLNGSHIIYKKDKDHFYIVGEFACDDYIYKKTVVDVFQLKITSDYHGFAAEITNLDMFGNSEYDIMFDGFPYILCCSKALGGNLANVYFEFDKNSIQNVFCKFNMPEKLVKETKMVFDRHAQTPKIFAQTPLPSLKSIDFSFFYPNGLPYNFQNIDHSLVLIIREYVDTNGDVNYSTRRGNTDDINVYQSRKKEESDTSLF